MLLLIMSREDKESCRQFIQQIEDNRMLTNPPGDGIGRDILFGWVFHSKELINILINIILFELQLLLTY